MAVNLTHGKGGGQDLAGGIKGWVMVALTLIFVGLYAGALVGGLHSPADDKLTSRLEPMIFVIIGYYFGRLPSQQNESTLKGEIGFQTQRAEAAQHAKEQALQAREALEEKVKNVRAALSAPGVATRGLTDSFDKSDRAAKEDLTRHFVAAALNILNT